MYSKLINKIITILAIISFLGIENCDACRL